MGGITGKHTHREIGNIRGNSAPQGKRGAASKVASRGKKSAPAEVKIKRDFIFQQAMITSMYANQCMFILYKPELRLFEGLV